MTEDEMKRAVEAARIMKDALGVKELSGTAETTQEMETGSPRTPGYEPDYGQTMKPAAQWPGDDSPTEPSPDSPSPDSSSPVGPSPDSKTEFDKALEALQQQGQQHDEPTDLDL